MRVKELITLLLDQDLDDEVFIECSTHENPNNRANLYRISTRYSCMGVYLEAEHNLQVIDSGNT